MSILIDEILKILQFLLRYLYNPMFTLIFSWFPAEADAVLKFDCLIGCGAH